MNEVKYSKYIGGAAFFARNFRDFRLRLGCDTCARDHLFLY